MVRFITKCEDCEDSSDLFWCSICTEALCSPCWDASRAHRKSATKARHAEVKTPYGDYKIMEDILRIEKNENQRTEMHRKDRLARWIGIGPAPSGEDKPELWDWSRMPYLIHEATHMSEFGGNQYPSVAAFIGNTGSGKSTLVKALIRLGHQTLGSKGSMADVPIPAFQGETHMSTSGDIHLYIDPCKATHDRPLLYADSEGLRGVVTMASIAGASAEASMSGASGLTDYEDDLYSEDIGADIRREHIPQPCSEPRTIAWAKNERSDRGYIVDHLYPRFLYTFSDVVVFVTKDPKTRKSDTEQLLDWASLGYETTLNQRTPPALIIAINNDDRREVDPNWHDTSFATRTWLQLLDAESETAQGKFAKFEDLKAKWLKWGVPIKTPSQLLQRYYSTITVICIPSDLVSSHATLKRQYEEAYRQIRTLATSVASMKAKAGLKLDTARFQIYVREALDHFAKEHDKPFDLQEASGRVRSEPRHFVEHVLNVLLMLRSNPDIQLENEIEALKCISKLVAANVAFSAYRKKEEDLVQHFNNYYNGPVSQVYNTFFAEHWRCEERSGNKRCTNVSVAHSKGHQYQMDEGERYGIFITEGEFTATFNPPLFADMILQHLEEMEAPYNAHVHSKMLRSVGNWLLQISTHRSCLSCLSDNPEHILSCHHVLCNKCAYEFTLASVGTVAIGSNYLKINSCPFGCSGKKGEWPWSVSVKPSSAGVRVLSLDGGGCRGVMELIILLKLEGYIREAGLTNVRISEMFDLIIGTSTGGIIALGIGQCQWATVDALKKFIDVAERVFTPRVGVQIPIWKRAAKYLYSYIYQTSEAEKVFKEIFSDDLLFNGPGSNLSPIKVAVAVCEDSGQVRLLSNYSRPFSYEDDGHECLVRPDKPEDEIKIWEAARSTSAAPTFFKAFTHAATGRIYLDGALKANNPVRLAEHERKLIWPCSGEFPDLHISIGTGTIRGVIATVAEGRVGGLLRQATGGVGMRVQIAKDAVRDIMNSETVWHNFCQPLTERDKSRYRRLNVPFTEEVPAMHDVSSLLVLQETAHTYCSTQEVAMQLKSIARQLVASTFYFDFESWTRPGQKWDCTGYLRNRMLPTHAHVESVENLISKRPVFRVYEDGVKNSVSRTTVSPNDNLRRGIWSQKMLFSVSDRRRRLDIKIMLQGVEEEYSISGFPRTLESS